MKRLLNALLRRPRPSARPSRARPVGLQVETLEDRQLMTAGISYNALLGVVTIEGSDSGDTARVRIDDRGTPDRGDDKVVVSLAHDGQTQSQSFDREGTALWFIRFGGVRSVVFNGNGGNDYFKNDTDIPCTAHGGLGSDTLIGGSGDDRLYGDFGNDTLFGNAGNNKLYGGPGYDALLGGPGNDFLDGGFEGDYVNGGGGNDMNALVPAPHGAAMSDVHQQQSPSCCFLAPLASEAQHEDLASRIHYLGDNRYDVLLYRQQVNYLFGWLPTFQTVADHQVVTFDGDLVQDARGTYDPAVVNGAFWPALYQRAYFQQHGVNYLSPGDMHDNASTDPADSFYSLTGRGTHDYNPSVFWFAGAGAFEDSDRDVMINALARGKNVVAATRGKGGTDWGGGVTTDLLVGAHCYTVLQIGYNATHRQWEVELRNPWGVDNEGNHATFGDPNDGVIVVSWNDFRHSMHHYYVS